MLDSSGQKKCHKMRLDIKLLHRNYKAMKAEKPENNHVHLKLGYSHSLPKILTETSALLPENLLRVKSFGVDFACLCF